MPLLIKQNDIPIVSGYKVIAYNHPKGGKITSKVSPTFGEAQREQTYMAEIHKPCRVTIVPTVGRRIKISEEIAAD